MVWQDFDTGSALERDTLERALPLVETESTGNWGAVINMTGVGDPGRVTIGFRDGDMTAGQCIEFLQLRPLLFGTAWKVLDLLLEADLTVQFNDRPGHELRGRLEHLPDRTVSIDPDAPPSGSPSLELQP